jgi:hypothetical protein
MPYLSRAADSGQKFHDQCASGVGACGSHLTTLTDCRTIWLDLPQSQSVPAADFPPLLWPTWATISLARPGGRRDRTAGSAEIITRPGRHGTPQEPAPTAWIADGWP